MPIDDSIHSCQVRLLYFFFCKDAGKNPWLRVAFFLGSFKKICCLLGKSDKQLTEFKDHRLYRATPPDRDSVKGYKCHFLFIFFLIASFISVLVFITNSDYV